MISHNAFNRCMVVEHVKLVKQISSRIHFPNDNDPSQSSILIGFDFTQFYSALLCCPRLNTFNYVQKVLFLTNYIDQY